MKILQVTHYMPPHTGGIERVAESLYDGLRERGHEVRWFASASPASAGHEGDRIRGRALNVLEQRIGLPYPVFAPDALAELASLAHASDVVLVHDCLYMSSLTALLAAKRARRPSLLLQHVGYVPYGRALDVVQRAAYLSVGRLSIALATRRASVSPHVPAFFRSIGIDAPFEVIPNGIDDLRFRVPSPEERAAARRAFGLPTSGGVVLFVGRLVAKKGIDRVVRAFEPLAASGAVLAVAGDGPLDGLLDAPFVRRLGFVPAERMAEVYAAGDVLVLPSRGEGFPLTVQEARMCGLATVVSDDPSFRANLRPSADCVLAADDADITAGLASLLASRPDPVGIAAEARRHWGREAFLDAYERLLRELAG